MTPKSAFYALRKMLFFVLVMSTLGFLHFYRARPSPQTPFACSRKWISNETSNNVIVTMATNAEFSYFAADLVRRVRCTGAYDGPIVLLYSDKVPLNPEFVEFGVHMHDARLLLPEFFREPSDPPCYRAGDEYRAKRISRFRGYYLKTAVFSVFFKQWRRVLWLDARNDIHYPLEPFFSSINSESAFLANPDAWPAASSILRDHFFSDCDPVLMARVERRFDLHSEYFQSTLMLFDTSLILNDTLTTVAELYNELSRVASSDQIIFSLYWHQIRSVYQPLPYRLPGSLMVPYDFTPRIRTARYIVTAWRVSS